METIIPSNSIKFLNPIPLPLVLIFEELAKVQQLDEVAKTQGPDKSQLLQLQAAEVAALWKEKIAIKAPRSSLEALAFLMSIMAFGLKTLINEEEAALLAWSIAQYEQAPMLFEYLSISLTIREVVEELIKKSEYISAVRLICLFKLDKEVSFSPSELLKKEIISFRGSALENRSNESSQAKEKDDGRLRAILELVADYQIGIDLPGDLIAKLMVQGERSAPVVRFSVEHDTSSSTSQAELKKKQLGGTETVLVRHTGVDEENLGKLTYLSLSPFFILIKDKLSGSIYRLCNGFVIGVSGTTLPADVNPSNETSNGNHPPLIHTYHRRRN
ncbi:hypothetical protein YC2023_063262 [Brassica napus]